MSETEILIKVRVFYDHEYSDYCESSNQCKFLVHGMCLIFDDYPYLKPGDYYRRLDQCKEALKQAKK